MRTVPADEKRIAMAGVAIDLLSSGETYSKRDLFGEKFQLERTWISRFMTRMVNEGALESSGISTTARKYVLKNPEVLLKFKHLIQVEDVQTKEKGLGQSFVMTPDLRALLDGLLLGDGHYCKLIPGGLSCAYQMSQREDRLEWLESIKKTFDSCGIKSKITWRPECSNFIKKTGKMLYGRPSHLLRTACYWNLKQERLRWYPDGEKIIPKDVDLSNPIVLAHWYMGDGSVSTDGCAISIATCCFSEDDLMWVCQKMWDLLNIEVSIVHCSGYPHLNMHARHAEKFLSLIRPYVASCFDYKIPVIWEPIACLKCGVEIHNRSHYAKYCDNCCSSRETGKRLERAFLDPLIYNASVEGEAV